MTRPISAVSAFAAAFCLTWTAPSSFAATGDWVHSDQARVRLLATDVGGRVEGVLEMELASGWKTYWRTPGAAGIAPVMDFSGSSNVSDVTVKFPVPHRFDDGYAISNVYDGRVLFPLDVAVGDPAQPVDLDLSLYVGVCEVVCIPERFEVSLAVPTGVSDPTVMRAVAEAAEKLPGEPEPGVLAAERIIRDGGTDKRPRYRVTVLVPAAEAAEVYIEGPADWYAAVPEMIAADSGKADYHVTFDRLGAKTALEEAQFRVTIVTPDRAIEHAIDLD
ncbi:protein-disulfide reductase DsbD domain-containing protein [Bauldia sp.]|uniref:protein-disulfide reductase DsbD domain-containing protein n=1 Tax=Bauldia sp. TaxID=2575872 RepID=UPI003BA8A0D6